MPKRGQGLLLSVGNLFSLGRALVEEIQKVICLEVEKYLVSCIDREDGLITSGRTNYRLYGWLVSIKCGGESWLHMHEQG